MMAASPSGIAVTSLVAWWPPNVTPPRGSGAKNSRSITARLDAYPAASRTMRSKIGSSSFAMASSLSLRYGANTALGVR